jgi:hypothetical protein
MPKPSNSHLFVLDTSIKRGIKTKFFFNEDDERASGDGAPDLRLHHVLACAQKLLDTQLLLDSLEEQLHLPAVLVKRGDDGCRQRRIAGQKDQGLAGLGIIDPHPTQKFGIVARTFVPIERHHLIADHASSIVHFGRIHAPGIELYLAKVLGAGQSLHTRIVRVAFRDVSKAGQRPRHKLHQLGKKRLGKIYVKSERLSISESTQKCSIKIQIGIK